MERLVIIDHANHTLFVDDVSEETLQQYGGEEEKYIEDNYTFDGDYSWDFITDAEYYPTDFESPLEIDFEELIP